MNILLTIELVPSSSWYDNVRSAVTKSQWDTIRSAVYKKANYVCEICGGVGSKHPVECHEIWDYDDVKFIQKLTGMIALCPSCHMVKHIGLAQVNGNMNKAISHLKKVNKFSKKQAEDYVAKSFNIWAKRSCNKWQVDLSYLLNFNIKIKEYAKQ